MLLEEDLPVLKSHVIPLTKSFLNLASKNNFFVGTPNDEGDYQECDSDLVLIEARQFDHCSLHCFFWNESFEDTNNGEPDFIDLYFHGGPKLPKLREKHLFTNLYVCLTREAKIKKLLSFLGDRKKKQSTTPLQADGVWKMCHSQTYRLDCELISSL